MNHSISLNKDFKVSTFINCNTKFLVYVITCEQCSVQYVGRTTRRLRDQLYINLYDISKDHSTNLERQWNLCHGKDVSSLCIQGVEKIVLSKRGGLAYSARGKCTAYSISIPGGLLASTLSGISQTSMNDQL